MKGANNLRLSRMEICLAILKVLDKGDVITQQQIMRKAGLNLSSSKEFLNFLVKMNIVREKNLGTRIVYSLTDKGRRLSSYFGLDEGNSILGGIFRID